MKFFFLSLLLSSQDLLAHAETQTNGVWNWDPVIIISLIILTIGYLLGHKRLRQKKENKARTITSWEITYFSLSIFFLIIALVSPLDFWSDQLQSWHMIQHMLIMMIAAPLFVMAAPIYVYLWSLPLRLRRKIAPLYKWLYGHNSGWYFFWQPILLWSIFALTLWIWHLPRFYEAALHTSWLHDLQHISFFVAACFFWRVLLDPIHRFRMGRALGIFYLFATTLHATLLGVFMTLSPKVWYSFYQGKTAGWNLTALEDQQLAGLIMWMPACTVYVVVMAFIFLTWSRETVTSIE